MPAQRQLWCPCPFNAAQVLTTSLLQRAIVYPKAYRGVDLKQASTACGQL